MTVTCPKCSKSLKVKDEFAGRMLKCPQCKKEFKADAKTKPAGAAALKAPPKPGDKKKDKPGIAINWGTIIGIGFASLIPIGIILFLMGPMRANRFFDSHRDQAEGDIRDVLEYALQCQASQSGLWNPRKGSSKPPSVDDLQLHPRRLTMSTPTDVRFEGFTSNGTFEGTYTYETGEVDVDMKLEGITLPSGIHFGANGTQIAGGMRSDETFPLIAKVKDVPKSANNEFHITGRVKGGGTSAELNGKKAEIYYPPEVDDDGNAIIPPPAATPTTKKS